MEEHGEGELKLVDSNHNGNVTINLESKDLRQTIAF